MYPIGENFDTPMMYQDLGNSTMGPMGFGGVTGGMYGGMMPPAYLGNTQLKGQLGEDKFEAIQNKKNKEDKNLLKTIGKVILVCGAVGFIPILRKNIKKSGGIGQFFKNQGTKISNYVKNIFKTNPPATNP